MSEKRVNTSTLWRLFDFLKPKRLQYFVCLLAVASIFASERLFTGWIVKLFTDAIAGHDLPMLWKSVLYWGLFALGMMLITPIFLYGWRASIVQGIANLRQALFRRMQRLPLGYYESRHSGEAMSILTNDVSAAEGAYQETILNLVQSLMQGIGAAIFMLFLKWDLALLVILSGVVPLAINAYFARPLRLVGQESQEKLAGLTERMGDLLAGFQIVRTFNLGDWILERFGRSNQDVFHAGLKRVKIESGLAAANDLSGIFVLLSIGAGTWMVLNGQISLGTLFGLIQLNNPVQGLFLTLGTTISSLQGSLAAGDRILAVLDTAPEPEMLPAPRIKLPPASLAGREEILAHPAELPPSALPHGETGPASALEFHDLSFSYTGSTPALQDLSFSIQAGQVAAFVGPSGSGKSTIFRLLMGHYPAASGSIIVAGKPIHEIPLHDLREVFAFVPQDAYLFSGSVLENIRYGKMDATEEEVIASAEGSCAHNFIQELPTGYDTYVGERGTHLSGGQRQRIAIARALLKNAPILLLDEATSALDSESEELVQRALEALMQGRTTLAIAHRLSTIENANIIYVVDRGRVVEQGRHADLVQKEGLYRSLYEMQFSGANGD